MGIFLVPSSPSFPGPGSSSSTRPHLQPLPRSNFLPPWAFLGFFSTHLDPFSTTERHGSRSKSGNGLAA